MLPVQDHLSLISFQYLARALRPNNPYHNVSPPPRVSETWNKSFNLGFSILLIRICRVVFYPPLIMEPPLCREIPVSQTANVRFFQSRVMYHTFRFFLVVWKKTCTDRGSGDGQPIAMTAYCVFPSDCDCVSCVSAPRSWAWWWAAMTACPSASACTCASCCGGCARSARCRHSTRTGTCCRPPSSSGG